jgi:hypothetical protein
MGIFFLLSGVVYAAAPRISAETEKCIKCHKRQPGVVMQWEDSAHCNAGVGCYECHKAEKGDPDAMEHEKFLVSTIVSPTDYGHATPRKRPSRKTAITPRPAIS